MKRFLLLGMALSLGALLQTGVVRASSGVTLTIVASTGLGNPIGIDWLPAGPYADQLLISENYIDGNPDNFALANRNTGALTRPWGSQAGWNNEIYFSTVRPGQGGGWVVGDVFSAEGDASGTGDASKIAQFAGDGTPVGTGTFATLFNQITQANETKLKRGGVVFDRFGVAGNDLIVIAANDFTGPSDVYRINSNRVVTHLAHLDVHLEGVTTIPDDSTKYGPWAGKILAAAETENKLWTIDPGPSCAPNCATLSYDATVLGMPSSQTIKGEDLWVIPPNSTFYGVEFGELNVLGNTHHIWKGDVSQWTDKVGRVLVAQEYFGQLYTIYWDPNANAGTGGFVSELVFSGSPDGSTGPAHWEHITFVPEPAALGDFVWNDLNANGIQDTGEPGFSNVTVQLFDSTGTSLLSTTTTDANGLYFFSNLTPGTYTVKFTLPSGSVFSPKDQGANDAIDSDANTTTGFTGTYTLTSGETNLTVDAGLTPQGKAFTIAGSMEGNLSNIRPGDWVNGGYSFKFVTASHAATSFIISGTVSIAVQCSQGGGQGGTIVVPLNQLPFGSSVPSILPVTATTGPSSIAWGVPANNTAWLASGDQNNVWVWSGAVQAPNLCSGKPMDDINQAVFNVTVSQAPPTGSLVDFRFHYRDPAAKGKPNTNCLNTSDPNRAKADVCGASWSGTKRDP